VPQTRTPARHTTVKNRSSSTLDRIREGVRRFILNDVSIGDFHKALRKAVRNGELSPNPLTGAAFRKIVTQVMNEKRHTSK
jgi:DNA-binding NarL/FixJ family response regulator